MTCWPRAMNASTSEAEGPAEVAGAVGSAPVGASASTCMGAGSAEPDAEAAGGTGLAAVWPGFVPPNQAGHGGEWYCPICRQWLRGHGRAAHMRGHGEDWQVGRGRPPGPAKAAAMAGPAAGAAAGARPPDHHPTEAQARMEALRRRILEPGRDGGGA